MCSLTELARTAAWTVSIDGKLAMSVTGAKSFTVSYGTFWKSGMTHRMPPEVTSSVCPSGNAFATVSPGTTLLPRFSTTTGCPRLALRPFATRRAAKSVPPPIPDVTRRIGFPGCSCPCATGAPAISTAAASRANKYRFLALPLEGGRDRVGVIHGLPRIAFTPIPVPPRRLRGSPPRQGGRSLWLQRLDELADIAESLQLADESDDLVGLCAPEHRRRDLAELVFYVCICGREVAGPRAAVVLLAE